ncbi:MAG TPA: xanthine dehydrogenase family protein subunit M [Acidimicrobiales bacterium]|nr:xanthine dehydrogenase family protein subunit M [Acidimicrobiales bacterium]
MLPTSLEEALSALAEYGSEAKVLAGGQSLIPLMSLRLAQPGVLVDLNGLGALSGIEANGSGVRIGAMTRHRAAERSEVLAERVPLMAEAMPLIGHAAIRSRGTIGGSLSHADPAAELPAVALATEATLIARSLRGGERTIPASEFFEGYFTTVLAEDEILCAVEVPAAPPSTGFCVTEVARRHGDFALVGVTAAVTIDQGLVTRARIALINVAERPVRAEQAEAALVGAKPEAAAWAEAAAVASSEIDPSGDLHATPAYRRKVARVCVKRALETAARRVGGGR